MKRVVFVLAACFAAAPIASAQTPSAKEAVQLSADQLIPATTDSGPGWVNILSTSLKVPQQKDLIMGVSLETGLMTNTLVKSKGGTADTSTAEANLQIRVLVDGFAAEPGIVTFDKRHQSLMAKFNGLCTDLNADGIVQFAECNTEEEVQLILDTLAAHHFNFVIDDLTAGDHSVVVQARVRTATTSQNGSAAATGAVGKGSLTVEEVRLVRGADITK